VSPVRTVIAFAVALALAAPAHAQVQVGKSEIAFTLKQMGVKFEGRFRRWKADVEFAPQALASSKAVIDVDLASVDLASGESEQEAKGPLWFDTAQFPVAHFASTSIRDVGGGRYEVAGKLAMKGIARDLVVPLTVKSGPDGTRVAEANFALRRLDYRLGEGEWADTGMVDNDVAVRARIVLGAPP
jgi:polyisoprenoid-binding protein YceI